MTQTRKGELAVVKHLLLAESDVALIAVPLTSQTRKMFDAAAFAAKPQRQLVRKTFR